MIVQSPPIYSVIKIRTTPNSASSLKLWDLSFYWSNKSFSKQAIIFSCSLQYFKKESAFEIRLLFICLGTLASPQIFYIRSIMFHFNFSFRLSDTPCANDFMTLYFLHNRLNISVCYFNLLGELLDSVQQRADEQIESFWYIATTSQLNT